MRIVVELDPAREELIDEIGRLSFAAHFPLGRRASALPERRPHLRNHLVDLIDSHVLPLDGVPRHARGHGERVAVRLDPLVARSERRKRVRILGDLAQHLRNLGQFREIWATIRPPTDLIDLEDVP